jgi:raffinose/stachyose/melibiose transport system substrate-binding protein
MKKNMFFIVILSIIVISALVFLHNTSNKGDDTDIIKIEFYQQEVDEVEIWTQIIENFEVKYPNIKVVQVTLPQEESETVLNTRILNGDSPDIYNEWYGQSFFDQVNLGNAKNMTGSPILSYIEEDALEQTKYNGNYYMIPISRNFEGVYYNIKIFKNNGIEIPKTLNEFWDVCEKLKTAGITPIVASDKEIYDLGHFTQNLIGLYLPHYKEDFKNIFEGRTAGSEIVGISDLADIIIKRTTYVQKGSLGTDTLSAISEFVNGNAAMMLGGSWIMPTINSQSENLEFSIFPFPAQNENDTQVMSGVNYAFVLSANSSSEKAKAAKLFVEYVVTDGSKYYFEKTSAPSCIKGISSDTSKYQLIQDLINDNKSFPWPYSRRWTDETYEYYAIAIQNLVSSQDKDKFYNEFEKAMKTVGKPRTYIDK